MTVKLNTVFSSSNKSFSQFISATEFWKVPETCCRNTQTTLQHGYVQWKQISHGLQLL